MCGHLFLAAAMCLLALMESAGAFQRNVTLCNRSAEKLDVAYAYDAVGTNEITSRGWRVVAPCSCRDLFNADVKTTEFYYYIARSGTFDALSGGSAPICVHPSNGFRCVNENRSRVTCRRAGGKWLTFAFSNATGGKSQAHLPYLGRTSLQFVRLGRGWSELKPHRASRPSWKRTEAPRKDWFLSI